ncbi:MAG: recombinase family protein [Ignavibacteriales bacterium]|nr:recombinase family protein [Ignavibacteriales bacterium]
MIDSDLGKSGVERDRRGFQQLVAEVGLGRAGIVMGLEVSRLARNSTDWHRLLEICALTETLILDEDGVYDPGHFNDRLLLGLKGTVSEAELHVLQARLQGGIRNKARRGELVMRLIGLVYDEQGAIVLDPDRQIQAALRAVFDTFARSGSATATVKAFRRQGLKFRGGAICRGLVRARWSGPSWSIPRCCGYCTIRAMLRCLLSAGRGPATPPMDRRGRRGCRASSGRC